MQAPNAPKTPKPNTHKFSHFFKSVIVELDRDPEAYPKGNLIEHNNLQDNEDKRIINNDARLTDVTFPQIPELINRHLLPFDPMAIDYTIRVDKEYHQSRYAYDIEVEIDDPNKAKLTSIVTNVVNQKEIQILDDKIVQCVQSINNSKTKRDFLLNFANSPVEFINKWVASQSRDLEEQRRSEFYRQNWVNEAIFHYTAAQNSGLDD
ncbi:1616_t:CDS:2 [Diversispora eburnea]|uniref:1616_t:CDS:1 n=1 Tax=Diversispora eburnea TaxID=1213867 RepID=A0A9N8ZDH5_9GLOM|nr:1616_t:CDS:2 [Diversispora eburnea]